MKSSSRTSRTLRVPKGRTLAVLAYVTIGLGTAANGWHVAGRALRPGVTVSAPAVVAIAAYLGMGCTLGGLLVTAVIALRRKPDRPRPTSRRPQPESESSEYLPVGVIWVAWPFFHALALVLLTPGETATMSVTTRLLIVGYGFATAVVAIGVLMERRPHDRHRAPSAIASPASR